MKKAKTTEYIPVWDLTWRSKISQSNVDGEVSDLTEL